MPLSEDWSLQQIAPYIGRMRAKIALQLIESYSKPNDLIVDPFSGCGVIPFEAVAQNRRVLAGDWNPYAALLTRAKLYAPTSLAEAKKRLENTWECSLTLVKSQDLRRVPQWVRSFFHPKTLREALAFRDACRELADNFLLACLLGILHHQRPGFLSYPSSHLVPYLRDRKFPAQKFPELYQHREVKPRLLSKIERSYRRIPEPNSADRNFFEVDARKFPLAGDIQAIITSPPYMNALDYVRDNRLRLWFIDRNIPENIELPSKGREQQFRDLIRIVCTRLAVGVKPAGYIILVLGEVTRRRAATPPSEIAMEVFEDSSELSEFSLKARYIDMIPDIRRSRKEGKGTRTETILVYQNNG